MINSSAILVLFQRNQAITDTIPADSGDSGAIPAELLDSRWNLWGTVKYCAKGAFLNTVPKVLVHDM